MVWRPLKLLREQLLTSSCKYHLDLERELPTWLQQHLTLCRDEGPSCCLVSFAVCAHTTLCVPGIITQDTFLRAGCSKLLEAAFELAPRARLCLLAAAVLPHSTAYSAQG